MYVKHIGHTQFQIVTQPECTVLLLHCPSTASFTEYPGVAVLTCHNAAVVGGTIQKDTVFYNC